MTAIIYFSFKFSHSFNSGHHFQCYCTTVNSRCKLLLVKQKYVYLSDLFKLCHLTIQEFSNYWTWILTLFWLFTVFSGLKIILSSSSEQVSSILFLWVSIGYSNKIKIINWFVNYNTFVILSNFIIFYNTLHIFKIFSIKILVIVEILFYY